MARPLTTLIALVLAAAAATPSVAGTIGPAALRSLHGTLAPRLADNAFGRPLDLQSGESARRIEGDVYAEIAHPFASVRAALADSTRWCDILILHLNVKHCQRVEQPAGPALEIRVGKKHEQPVQSAALVALAWRPATSQPDYFAVDMAAREGPYDTRDYRLLVEAIPIDAGRTFIHMGYAFSYGTGSHLAMQLYLGTAARDKVGFTQAGTERGRPAYVGGMRGVVERNTMRYYLAIDAYLDAMRLPREQQLEQRLQAWFDATERYARQLHEVERDDYLRMKRNEVQRQAASR
jgi:hypothetical protein